jgi:branched-chain amino acid transport system ATP-binding protein
MLSIRNLSTRFGPIEIVRAVDMDVAAGECVALIGWSGSGKTTLMKTIAGLLEPSSGKILFEGSDIVLQPAHMRVAKGLAMVPEGRHLFSGMSVYENLLVGAHSVRDRQIIARQENLIFELFPILRQRRNQITGTLSGGEQQMCAIGRALMSAPRLLLIDELSLGLAPIMVARLLEALKAIRRLGTTLVIVEQDVSLALTIADRGYIIQRGQIELTDSCAKLRKNPMVQQNFIGYQTTIGPGLS